MNTRYLHIVITVALLLLGGVANAVAATPKGKKVETEYSYTVPSHQSDDDARQTAIQRARNQALAEAFGGEEISQINSTLINSGAAGADAVNFQSHMQSRVRGVWVRDIREPRFRYAQDPETGMRVITVSVCGEAYPLAPRKFPCSVQTMRYANGKLTPTDRFISGDILVIDLTAPSHGYCAVYLADENNCVTRVLPNQQGDGAFRIVGDRRYQLLHPDLPLAEGGCKGVYDNLEFYTEGKQVINWLCIPFSNRALQRPPDRMSGGVTSGGTTTLPGTDIDTFNRWALECELNDDSFSMLRIPVFILPNQ